MSHYEGWMSQKQLFQFLHKVVATGVPSSVVEAFRKGAFIRYERKMQGRYLRDAKHMKRRFPNVYPLAWSTGLAQQNRSVELYIQRETEYDENNFVPRCLRESDSLPYSKASTWGQGRLLIPRLVRLKVDRYSCRCI